MNRFVRAIVITDGYILIHGFVRPVWYIDWRWHKNQYDQAAMVLSAGLALDCAGVGALVLHHKDWFDFLVLVPLTGVLVWMYGHYVKELAKASQDYERDPAKLHRSQRLFQVVFVPFILRLFLLVQGLMLGSTMLTQAIHHPTAYDFIEAISDYWMVVIGCALYVAGVPHPPWERKKKKERAVMGAPLLSPSA